MKSTLQAVSCKISPFGLGSLLVLFDCTQRVDQVSAQSFVSLASDTRPANLYLARNSLPNTYY